MTPGEVRVTVARMCAPCNGSGRIPLVGLQLCKYCDGNGAVWEPVTCDICAHSAHAGPNLFCDLLRCRVDPGFACQSWEPLMDVSDPRS